MEGLPAPSKQLVERRCTLSNVIRETNLKIKPLGLVSGACRTALQLKPQFDYAMPSHTPPNAKLQFSVLEQM